MLIFIGLGLFDERDISIKGLETVKSADRVFLEAYTSRLMGAGTAKLEEYYGKEITVLYRENVENNPEEILLAAESGTAAFLTAGDPMVSTTHSDLRIRAEERGIKTGIIHGASIQSAVCGLSGLQNYRFGKSCSVPYPEKGWFPLTPAETIMSNMKQGLHTLVYLDIKPDRFMTVNEGIEIITEMCKRREEEPPELFVGIARAGSENPAVRAGKGSDLISYDFGGPLQILIVPAELHMMEEEYLKVFAGL
ncbi:diphthine synthase [Methanoplanus endosymbiosus]|uniref:Diphthine synthase n=1 Tax=Methanoplanus endosymbiosus TaxID=33865 RepID=A0A9E7PND7_9EURY|nr:diphthine synthase [Methanoplanus endosymbiosus]UUX93468.1 diphthine synthase [Methanoplanus endosymbiosus]